MHVHVWELLGILIVIGALIWGNWALLGKMPTIQKIVYVLLVLFGVFLVLGSLGILPDMGVTVSGS